MKRGKWIMAVMLIGMSMILGGCCSELKPLKNIFELVGGWIKGEETEGETEAETEVKPEVEAEHPADFTGGTDEPGTGLSVEYYVTFGNTLIFEIINDSDVSYESVAFQYEYIPDEADSAVTEMGVAVATALSDVVPAFSSVYVPVEVPGYWILNGERKDENPEDTFHYNKLSNWIARDIDIVSYEVSSEDLQNAADYIEILDVSDISNGLAGLAGNRSDRAIRFQVFAVRRNTGNVECAWVEHRDYLAPRGTIMEDGDGDRPGYVSIDGKEGAALYVGDLIAPTVKDNMTLEQMEALGESLYEPPADYCEDCEIFISYAYFEP